SIPTQPGIGPCLLCRDQAQLGVAVHPAQLLGFDPPGGVKAFDLSRDLYRELAGVEERDLADPGLTLQHRRPCAGGVQADGRYRPNPGDDHPLHRSGEGVRTRATSRSLSVTTCASRLIRRMRPERTWPGPISRKSALPRATISTTEAVHWTGL